ncbi:hypothetical protein BI308_21970 [Roseofilum reptotaenium AO1-A]|uniref:Uncharacterized protein n=1 Tax=Roseofilum reptotaenium AO1-A TaxID=1925591 RepID=A0A1L9QL47_9CYAN|nr:hypothetical protein BI308_21970 [Roseofilum reptotaenium AO1-A]
MYADSTSASGRGGKGVLSSLMLSGFWILRRVVPSLVGEGVFWMPTWALGRVVRVKVSGKRACRGRRCKSRWGMRIRFWISVCGGEKFFAPTVGR